MKITVTSPLESLAAFALAFAAGIASTAIVAGYGVWVRKLPCQVDSAEVETSWLNTLGLNTAGGTLPRESCGRYSL